MPTCSECDRDLPRSAFSKGQLKKKEPSERRCKECVEENTLRFGVGDRVDCCVGGDDEWCSGTIMKLWYVDCSSVAHPYQIILDDGGKIYAPDDEDHCIKASEVPPPDCVICYDNAMSADNLIMRDCGCRGEGAGFVHIDCLTRSALVKVESIIRTGQQDYNPFTTCGTCHQQFSGDDPSNMALAKKCYERFIGKEDENPFWHSFSIQNLSDAFIANGRADEASALLDKRAATLYQRIENECNNDPAYLAELEDELCDLLVQTVHIDFRRKITVGSSIAAVLNQAQHLNERTKKYGFSCHGCRKSNILRYFCYLAWENGDLGRALKYAKEALSILQDDGEHAELKLSNSLYECGCLKVAIEKRSEGIQMIERAINIDTRLYGERHPVTQQRTEQLQRMLNGEVITRNVVVM